MNVFQLNDGYWIIALYENGTYYAPCRKGREYFGSLEYVSNSRSNVYVYKNKKDALKALKRIFVAEI